MIRFSQLLLLIYGLTLLAACGVSDQSAPMSATPLIEQFEVSTTRLQVGSRLELIWRVRNGRRVILKENDVIIRYFDTGVRAEGMLEVWPTRSARYRLEATNGASSTAREVDVEVLALNPRPGVSLTLTETEILKGEQATLRWDSEHVSSVELTANGEPLNVPDGMQQSGAMVVSPQDDTTYRILGVGVDDIAVREVSLSVFAQPRILVFDASPGEGDGVAAGDAVTLRWQTEGAAQVLLSDEHDPVSTISGLEPNAGEFVVRPEKDTRYQLTAVGEAGLREVATVSVDVRQNPEIVSFVAEPSVLVRGDLTTLLWNTAWAEVVTLYEVGRPDLWSNLPAGGSLEVQPEQNTSFLLVAESGDRRVEASVDVTIVPEVRIERFIATPAQTELDQPVTLSWETTGATAVRLFANDSEVTLPAGQLDGQVTLSLFEDTRFLLQASGPGGESTRELRLVLPQNASLRIISFTATPESVALGDTVTLSWQASSARAITLISNLDGPLDVGEQIGTGTLQVTPTETTRYTLTVEDLSGLTVSQDLSVRVNPPVRIASFEASASSIIAGERLSLEWSVVNAVGVELVQGEQRAAVDPVGTLDVTGLVENTTFELIAYGLGGPVREVLEVEVLPAQPLELLTFEASASAAPLGAPVTLIWETSTNAEVRVFQQIEDDALAPVSPAVFASSGRYLFNMEETVRFVLEARGPDNSLLTASLSVSLLPPLTIDRFELVTQDASSGDVLLQWATTGAVSATLRVEETAGQRVPVEGELPLSGDLELRLERGATVVFEVSNGFEQLTEQLTWTPEMSQQQPLVLSWLASREEVAIDDAVTLSWRVVEGVELELVVFDDLGEVRSRRVLGSQVEGDLRFGPVTFPARFELQATTQDGLIREAEALVVGLQGGEPDGVTLSEVFVGEGPEGDLQGWVELFNQGNAPVSLWDLGLEYGQAGVLLGQAGLRGVIRPGECVVVGLADGPTQPDWRIELSLAWRSLLGADATIKLLDWTAGGTPLGQALVDQFVSEGLYDVDSLVGERAVVRNLADRVWALTAFTTPGQCFGVNRPTASSTLDGISSRPRGPEAEGRQVRLMGWGLEQVLSVWFGTAEAVCDWQTSSEVVCEVPAGQGSVPLVLEGADGVIRYEDWYTHEPVDRCGLETAALQGQVGETLQVEGWVVEGGLTADAATTIFEAAWGIGPVGTDPALAPALWSWFDASLVGPCVDDARCDGGLWYAASVLATDPGSFAHVFRFKYRDEPVWTYCDRDGTFNDDPNAGNLMSVDALGQAEVLSE